jgi:hypothetical protein
MFQNFIEKLEGVSKFPQDLIYRFVLVRGQVSFHLRPDLITIDQSSEGQFDGFSGLPKLVEDLIGIKVLGPCKSASILRHGPLPFVSHFRIKGDTIANATLV